MPLILYFCIRLKLKKRPMPFNLPKDRLREMGKMSADEIIMAVIFGILLLLWADVPPLLMAITL